MKGKSVKKLASYILSAALLLSAAGCGNKNIVVDDYGDNSSTEKPKSERTDDLNIPLGNGASLRDIFGERVTWADSLVVDGTTINVNQSYEVPDVEGMSVFDVRILDDGKDKEEEIVKAIFGDTAKKIEKLSYKNKEDYMSLMYKYKEVYSQTFVEDSDGNINQRSYYIDENGNYTPDNERYMIINSGSTVDFKWIDEKMLYIHMYEGIYNGLKYGLLMAYEGYTHTRYIFLDPISINDLYPGADYKSLVVRDKREIDLEEIQENRCSKSKPDVIKEARNFLADKLLLGDDDNVVTTDSSQYLKHNLSNEVIGTTTFYRDDYNMSPDDERDMSMLLYSDKDYITSIKKLLDYDQNDNDSMAGVLNYQVLAEQRDIFKEQIDNGKKYVGEFIYQMEIPEEEQAHFVADGYAVYFGSKYNLDMFHNFGMFGDNCGIIKVNESGVIGVDLMISTELECVTSNVKLMDFDSLTESVKKQLPDEMNLDKIDAELYIREMRLCYSTYVSKNLFEGEGELEEQKNFTIIPLWVFDVDSQTPGGVTGTIYVNAMDGTVMRADMYTVGP